MRAEDYAMSNRRDSFNPSESPDLCEAILGMMTVYEIREALGRTIKHEDQLHDLGIAHAKDAGSSGTWPVRQVQVVKPGQPPRLYWLTRSRDRRGRLRILDRGRGQPLAGLALGPDGEVEEEPGANPAQPPSA